MTTKETAEYLRLGVRTVQIMAKEGTLPCTYVGNRRRFDQADIDAYLQANRKADPLDLIPQLDITEPTSKEYWDYVAEHGPMPS